MQLVSYKGDNKQVTNEVVSNMLKANELLREVNLTISDKLLALECNY